VRASGNCNYNWGDYSPRTIKTAIAKIHYTEWASHSTHMHRQYEIRKLHKWPTRSRRKSENCTSGQLDPNERCCVRYGDSGSTQTKQYMYVDNKLLAKSMPSCHRMCTLPWTAPYHGLHMCLSGQQWQRQCVLEKLWMEQTKLGVPSTTPYRGILAAWLPTCGNGALMHVESIGSLRKLPGQAQVQGGVTALCTSVQQEENMTFL